MREWSYTALNRDVLGSADTILGGCLLTEYFATVV